MLKLPLSMALVVSANAGAPGTDGMTVAAINWSYSRGQGEKSTATCKFHR
jgi:hypothetical protein